MSLFLSQSSFSSLQTDPDRIALPPVEVLKDWYRQMLYIRRFEELCSKIYTSGIIRGFCHLCIGQEAVPVSVCAARDPQDTVITSYRCHGHAITCGLSGKEVLAELMGRQGGSSKGKGGSMHIFSPQGRFYGGHGIVGASSALGTGMAFAHKYKNEDAVCCAFFGDGAANQGQWFESMNMAGLWKLPVLYIVENNGYSMGTAVERGCAGADQLWRRGEAFDIPGYRCSGDDVVHLYRIFKMLLQEVRRTSCPIILEIDTYRFKGHSMSDPGHYRSKESLEQAKDNRDPLTLLENRLIGNYGVSSNDIETIQDQIKGEIRQLAKDSESWNLPGLHELDEDVWIETA
jgi:pyruvate dehydrogenase E1 component alpha subunit